MVYILYDDVGIFGVYETIQLLKTNCFVFLYDIFEVGRITKEEYFFVKKKLFESSYIDIVDLKKLMETVGIKISTVNLEKNGVVALESILEHIKSRFEKLHSYMAKDSRVTVTIPGKNSFDNLLITYQIEENWRELDPDNFKVIMLELKSYLIKSIQKLQLDFEDRVQFGQVSDTKASETSYQIWSADRKNWNLPNGYQIPGEDLALCFKYQVPGVYGIVLDPKFGYVDL